MPPKIKFTKENIVQAGLDIVREEGVEGLTARSLGNRLGCSPQPIFSYFENMKDLEDAVVEKAKDIYNGYISEGLLKNVPFKNAGLQYIKFAEDEPQLFNLLFMTKRGEVVTHILPKNDENYSRVISALEKTWSVSKEKAEYVYNHLSVYTHGLAVLFSQRSGIFTMDEADEMLSQVFHALMEVK